MTIALTTPRTWVTGEVPTSALLNQHVRDNSDYFTGEVAWTAVAFQNGWGNLGSGWSAAAYRKIGDLVWLKGTVSAGTLGAAIFTLPAGYRPLAECLFAIESNNALGRVDVGINGTVFTSGIGSNVYVQLDGIVFSTV